MTDDTRPSTHVPLLRALLFTDLCDSTMLVERIGDAAAATLFQQHDRLVLALQQRWHGQQIDRSDGLFLLFERPVDALGFALEYQQGLQAMGTDNGVVLRARAGLHVGEVILWSNSPDAVALGSKQVEVEGLAKPLAARLMQLARPGQILVSSTAESLVRRATADLGPVGGSLKWKTFGRWRFKGVAQPMEVLGVQAPGTPKARRPRETAKAMRDVPFWRRPVAMAAEAIVAIALAVGLWFLLRPQPAIAFVERDWVVLADAQNLTGNELLGDGVTTAFRVALEQSRYVNVLSELTARDTLGRMLLPEGAALDRSAAVQVAARVGARVVLAPVAREVQGKLRVSVDVLEPATRQVVYTLHADGTGYGSALRSIDKVVSQLRSRLGEAMGEIGKASAPLPDVATADLDALNAYAKGVAAYGGGNVDESIRFFDIALGIDPGFAMAHLARMRSLVSLGRRDEARSVLQHVRQLRARLTTREALYMDAWGLELFADSESAALDAWKTLATLYPDHHGANVNHALAAFALGRLQEAATAVKKVNVPQNAMRALSLQLQGRIELAAGDTAAALATLGEAAAMTPGRSNRHRVAALAVAGRQAEAIAELQRLPAGDVAHWLEAVSLDLEQGHATAAADRAVAADRACKGGGAVCEWLSTLSLVSQAAAGRCASTRQLDGALQPLLEHAADPGAEDRGQRLYFAAAIVYAGQRMGRPAWASRHLPALAQLATVVEDAKAAELVTLVRATAARAAGRPDTAAALLRTRLDERALFQTHSALAAAYADLGEEASRARQIRWLHGHRGLAYAEFSGSSVLQPLNVRDSRASAMVQGCAAPGAEPQRHRRQVEVTPPSTKQNGWLNIEALVSTEIS